MPAAKQRTSSRGRRSGSRSARGARRHGKQIGVTETYPTLDPVTQSQLDVRPAGPRNPGLDYPA